MKLHRNDPVHFGFEIFKMVAIAMVTMKIKTFFLSDCNKNFTEMILGMCRCAFQVENF